MLSRLQQISYSVAQCVWDQSCHNSLQFKAGLQSFWTGYDHTEFLLNRYNGILLVKKMSPACSILLCRNVLTHKATTYIVYATVDPRRLITSYCLLLQYKLDLAPSAQLADVSCFFICHNVLMPVQSVHVKSSRFKLANRTRPANRKSAQPYFSVSEFGFYVTPVLWMCLHN